MHEDMKKFLFSLVLIAALICSLTLAAKAHPGGTDGKGGHTKSSTGEYHYHHGYSAHDHYDMDGDGIDDCPYDFKDNTNRDNARSTEGAETVSDISHTAAKKKDYSDLKLILLALGIPALLWIAWYYLLFKFS